MTTQEVKQQYITQQWMARIQDCRSSGISTKQWCEQNGIQEGTYYYWLKKLRIKIMELLPSSTESTQLQQVSKEKTTFTKIELPMSVSSEADVTISINGINIGFRNSASAELVHTILGEVRSLC